MMMTLGQVDQPIVLPSSPADNFSFGNPNLDQIPSDIMTTDPNALLNAGSGVGPNAGLIVGGIATGGYSDVSTGAAVTDDSGANGGTGSGLGTAGWLIVGALAGFALWYSMR
jgi:hypothetical protein